MVLIKALHVPRYLHQDSRDLPPLASRNTVPVRHFTALSASTGAASDRLRCDSTTPTRLHASCLNCTKFVIVAKRVVGSGKDDGLLRSDVLTLYCSRPNPM